jgi:hypothetical protein
MKFNRSYWLLVAHACNPSYLGGQDQKDHNLRPAQTESAQDPTSKITRAKWSGGVAQVLERLICHMAQVLEHLI